MRSRGWEIAQKTQVWMEVGGYLLAAPLNVYLILCLLKSGLLHGNLKIMLINLSVTCIAFAWSRLIFHFDVFLQQAGFGPDNIACRKVQSISRLFYDSSCYMIAVSMFLVTTERAVATYFPKSYEQQRGIRKVTLAISFLRIRVASEEKLKMAALYIIRTEFTHIFSIFYQSVIFQWTLILCISIITFVQFKVTVDSCDPSTAPPSTSILYVHDLQQLVLAGIGAVGVILAGCFLTALLYFNIKRRKACDIGKLNLRYQYSENIATIRFLMPVTLIYSLVLSLVVMFFVLYHIERHSKDMDIVKLNVYEQGASSCGAWFGLLYPLICFLMHRPIRDKVEKDFSAISCAKKSSRPPARSTVIKSVSGDSLCFNNETSIYFDHLNVYWNSHPNAARQKNMKREPGRCRVFGRKKVDSSYTRSPSPTGVLTEVQ
ncbi:hypothetical protein L596_011823 [Steinernema carpocapsae]|uniref:G-protein coupled receptors family 1 profile domain-containing protein n=1 Tax=Steinernema carpocapsae TaxID=34508 RepID=A0A4U5NW31_STECR|nr:hypothetical protein L596_011823 [Steinernema carpocapsae]